MSILSGLIGKVVKPIIERRVKREMCSGKEYTRWATDSEAEYAGDVGGRKRGGSARTGEAEKLHRIPDQPAG